MTETVEAKSKTYFSVKEKPFPQINVVCKDLGFWQQTFARFNIDIMGGGVTERMEFEKLSYFLNLLDFQLLPQQVL